MARPGSRAAALPGRTVRSVAGARAWRARPHRGRSLHPRARAARLACGRALGPRALAVRVRWRHHAQSATAERVRLAVADARGRLGGARVARTHIALDRDIERVHAQVALLADHVAGWILRRGARRGNVEGRLRAEDRGEGERHQAPLPRHPVHRTSARARSLQGYLSHLLNVRWASAPPGTLPAPVM